MPLFPIHDYARADDIRMRRRRAAFLIVGIVGVPWMLFSAPANRSTGHHHNSDTFDLTIDKALSDIRLSRVPHQETLPQSASGDPTRRFSIAGDTLTVDLPCAGTVTLLPTTDLGKDAILSVRPGQDAMLQAVTTDGGIVSEPDSCHGRSQSDFILRVDPGRSLRIVQQGHGDIHGGRFTGPVAIDGSGSGTVFLAGVGRLADQQQGSGGVVVDEVSGDVAVQLAGSGDLQIKRGQVSRMSAIITRSGDMLMGDVTIGDAHVELTGSGDLTMGTVDGRLDASTLHSGDIVVASVTADAVRLNGGGSGDIAIRAGKIGNLVAVRRGSGDLTVQAIIGSGTLSHDGSGDVSIPHVTGDLLRTGKTDDDDDRNND